MITIEDAKVLCKIFNKSSVEEVQMWNYVFSISTTTFFYQLGFIAHYVLDDICYINSASINTQPFSRDMLLYLKDLLDTYNKVVVSSTKNDILTLYKKGFKYNSTQCIYYRDLTQEDLSNLLIFNNTNEEDLE